MAITKRNTFSMVYWCSDTINGRGQNNVMHVIIIFSVIRLIPKLFINTRSKG